MSDSVSDRADAMSPPAGSPTSTGVWLGALMWLVQPLYVAAEFLVVARVTVPYSMLDNTISDLGATTCTTICYAYGPVPVCSPWHGLSNWSFVAFGVLVAAGAVLLRCWLPRGGTAAASVVLWVISGLSSIACGLVPLDQNLGLHVLLATPVFLAQPLALITLGLALRRRRPGLAWGTMVVGLVSAAATAAFIARTAHPELGGLLERLALWPAYLWTPVIALAVLRSSRAESIVTEPARR